MMVVGIHTYFLSDALVPMVIRQVLNCAVPLFLAISGYFLSHKDVSDSNKYWGFIKKQVPKVYMPCIIWSIPLFLLEFWSGSFSVSSLLLLFVCGYSIYYFVALIIQYYFLLPVFQKVDTYIKFGLACAVSLLCISFVTYLMHYKGVHLPLIAFAGPFPLWLMFFCEGILIGKKGRDYNIGWVAVLAIVALALSVTEAKYIFRMDGGGTGVKPSSFIFSALMILLLFSAKTERFFKKLGWAYYVLKWIGGLSFGIYLMHCYIVSCLSVVALPSVLNYWLIKWAIVLGLASAIVALGKKYIPWTIKYLGFR